MRFDMVYSRINCPGILYKEGMRDTLHNRYKSKLILTAVLLAVLLPAVQMSVFAAGSSAGAAKTVNMSVVYAVTTLLSLLLAGGYCVLLKKKDVWLLFLHASVVIVNLGYFALSISKTLGEALLANRIAYFGSVFLPLCMLMAIMDVCRVRRIKWLPGLLICCSVAVFILAASPGYLDCYYKEVSLVFINGMAKLEKVYGPLHPVYLVYLLGYFGMMTGVILTSIQKKKVASHKHAAILLTVVFLNIAIWFVEQLIYTEFEFLSVSYIVSELLLLMLYGMMQDYGILYTNQLPAGEETAAAVREALPVAESVEEPSEEELTADSGAACAAMSEERIAKIAAKWSVDYVLTGRECDVLCAILQDKRRKDIASEMCVTEHTVKKHTGNIFSKLEVSSRSELFAKAETEVA